MIEKRTLDELEVRYALEPSLKDIYVEGTYDKRVYEWFFQSHRCNGVSIFAIDTIEISDNLLEELGLRSGNRSRVLALAISIGNFQPGTPANVRCIVDRDFDFLLGESLACNCLLYTDYTSIDLYFCRAAVLEKVMRLGYGRVPRDPNDLFVELLEILKPIFLIRATNEKLNWGMTFHSYRRSLSLANGELALDEEDLLNKYLTSNGRANRREEFVETLATLEGITVDDLRKSAHGDDFIEVLGFYFLKVFGGRSAGAGDSASVRARVFPALELEMLAEEPLFRILLEVYCENDAER